MMETVSIYLQPHKALVGTIASVITIIQFFSGAFICLDIYKMRSTEGISAIPFVGGTVIGVLVLKYAIMIQDKAMFQVNMAAVILNAMYLICYTLFSSNRKDEIYKPCAIGISLIAFLFGFIAYTDATKIKFWYGLIVTILMLLLMASPLIEIKDILRKKDASSIPFPITFMAFFVSISWFIYGIILLNDFMIVQNVIGTILCLTQLVLYFKYPAKPHKE